MMPPDVEQMTDSQSSANQSIIIDTGKHVAAVAVCAAICGLSAALAMAAMFTASRAERRADLASYYLMDPHSRTPEELASWAKFNRDHEQRKE